jgi:hypothetical protein
MFQIVSRLPVGRVISVGVPNGYGLDGPMIEFRWGEARFSAPVQTGRGAYPPSCIMGTWSKAAISVPPRGSS